MSDEAVVIEELACAHLKVGRLTLNVPKTLNSLTLPMVDTLQQQLDAWRDDPLGGMRVSEQAFERWGSQLGRWAAERCDGRVLALLEGGYDVGSLPDLVAAYCRGAAASPGSRDDAVEAL